MTISILREPFFQTVVSLIKWASTSYKWSEITPIWHYKWVTGVVTPVSGVITLLITGRGPTLYHPDIIDKHSLKRTVRLPFKIIGRACPKSFPIPPFFKG